MFFACVCLSKFLHSPYILPRPSSRRCIPTFVGVCGASIVYRVSQSVIKNTFTGEDVRDRESKFSYNLNFSCHLKVAESGKSIYRRDFATKNVGSEWKSRKRSRKTSTFAYGSQFNCFYDRRRERSEKKFFVYLSVRGKDLTVGNKSRATESCANSQIFLLEKHFKKKRPRHALVLVKRLCR